MGGEHGRAVRRRLSSKRAPGASAAAAKSPLATLIDLKAKGHIDEAEFQSLRAGLAQSV